MNEIVKHRLQRAVVAGSTVLAPLAGAHDLGIAVVQEMAELYGSELVISRRPLDGAAVEVRL